MCKLEQVLVDGDGGVLLVIGPVLGGEEEGFKGMVKEVI